MRPDFNAILFERGAKILRVLRSADSPKVSWLGSHGWVMVCTHGFGSLDLRLGHTDVEEIW